MDLRASALDAQGLTATLQSEARRWAERSDIQVKVQIAGRPVPLSPNMEQNLLRITQEAVTNASKHAHAANVSVRMDVEPRRLRLRIADDGCGFPVPDLFSHAGGHFGLIGMRERAERMRGTLKLESQPDQGTLIEVVVPLP